MATKQQQPAGTPGEYGRVQRDLSSMPPGELVCQVKNHQAEDVIVLSKVLISVVGKEEAGKLISKARYDIYHKAGKKVAERLGNPKDLDSYLEEYFLKSPRPEAPVWIAPGEFIYRTKNKAVRRTSNYCFKAEAFKRFADKEMLEFLGKYYCVHDIAWAEGFNPNMKIKLTKSFLFGDPYCEFTVEV
ncbi:MAG: L-2-amino-thiazoline-4-carboxylic acid hydrolase [Chloroflexota bacterium]